MEDYAREESWFPTNAASLVKDESKLKPTPSSAPVNREDGNAANEFDDFTGELLIMIGEIDESVFPTGTLIVVDHLI